MKYTILYSSEAKNPYSLVSEIYFGQDQKSSFEIFTKVESEIEFFELRNFCRPRNWDFFTFDNFYQGIFRFRDFQELTV